LKLPEGLHADILVKRSREQQNLILAEGNAFVVHGDEATAQFQHHIRLCFAYETLENIREGVKRFAQVLADIHEESTALRN
jgi:DNA-binding transcriptional MocR family regulator